MGRTAIDEEAIRLIEEANPDVQFDWPRILKQTPEGKTVEAEEAASPRGRGAERRAERRGSDAARREPARTKEAAAPEQVGDLAVTSEDDEAAAMTDEVPEGAAFRRLGAEALARLRARFAEIMARIAERPADDAEREELKGRADRLNPDNWVTDADVEEGLEQYEAVYESIRAVVGHARKRRDRNAELP